MVGTRAAAATLLLAALLILFANLGDRLPGYWQDESGISYNAWTIARDGTDEHGEPYPALFRSKPLSVGWPMIDLIAVVFKVTGPSILAARVVPATIGLGTILLLGLLGYAMTRRPSIGLLTAATALLNPWLFEPTRVVFEVVLIPLLVAGLLLVLWRVRPGEPWSLRGVVAVAALLALITYAYSLGRLLGPLLAAGLLIHVPRDRWRHVVEVWAAYVFLMIPYVAVEASSPGALTSRLNETGYLSNTPFPDVLARFAQQFLGNISPVKMLLEGDPNQRHHIAGVMGSLLIPTFAVGLLGIDRAVHRFLADRWSRFLLYGAVVSIVPASLTNDVFHAHRLVALPVFLIALAIPALQWLLEHRSAVGRWLFVAIAVATLVQGAHFQVRWHEISPTRGTWFDEAYPRLLDEALATGASPIYIIDSVQPGYIHAYWYGTLKGVDLGRFDVLPPGQKARSGEIVISSEPKCGPCDVLDESPSVSGGVWRVYRVP